MSKKKFSVVVADCPGSFQDKLSMSDVARGALANYDTMTISQIKALPVKDLLEPAGAILALWVPSSLLQQGLDTMTEWGFSHKQTYIWVKSKKAPLKDLIKQTLAKASLNEIVSGKMLKEIINKAVTEFKLNDMFAFGMGRLFRQTHEICLIGTSNNGIYKSLENKSQRSISCAPNLKHSTKPEHLQDSLEAMFPRGNKLELFARRIRPGWICLGNEICNGEDIRDSLSKLI
jgi:N6-adenosine-specific RNA methylase IME4